MTKYIVEIRQDGIIMESFGSDVPEYLRLSHLDSNIKLKRNSTIEIVVREREQ